MRTYYQDFFQNFYIPTKRKSGELSNKKCSFVAHIFDIIAIEMEYSKEEDESIMTKEKRRRNTA